ncbi:MAG: ABC transporter ATP-binding protein/permease [Clostridia bacterium]|nr:ABC transporter ATP-binding protein/permease [Clostridia bacterium]
MIKKLVKYVKGYWKYVIATPIMVLIETLLEILIPYVMANLIDYGIYAGNMGEIRKYGFMLLGYSVLSLVFGMGAAATAPFGSTGFAKNLRRAMYYKVQDYSFQSIDKFSTASIVTRLTTDVTNVQQAFQMITRICFRAPSMIVFALIAAFRVNSKLALVYLSVVPFLFAGLIFMASVVRPIFERMFKKYDKLNRTVQENLYAVRVVKSFNRQEFEKKKFRDVSGDIFGDGSKIERTMAFMAPIMQFSMYTCIILLSWLGAKMIVQSGNNELYGLTTGQLMSMITYTTQILMSLMMMSMVFVMILTARASVARIVEILDEVSEIQEPADPVMEVKDGSIDFENVKFNYKTKVDNEILTEKDVVRHDVLSDINLHIESGMTVGIIGGTGSSKSSLVQLIPRLYDATGGCVKVGGVNVKDYDIKTLRDNVSMVLQKNVLFTGSIRENLLWGNENATEEEIRHALDVSNSAEFVDKFEKGLDTMLEHGATNVSGGQKQRLCIARALLKKPKILILDDSTSACDMTTDAKIRNALKNEAPDVTKIIIAQRISSVQDSDIIIVMDDGKVSACGNHDYLMANSNIYREVYETQNKSNLGGDFDA